MDLHEFKQLITNLNLEKDVNDEIHRILDEAIARGAITDEERAQISDLLEFHAKADQAAVQQLEVYQKQVDEQIEAIQDVQNDYEAEIQLLTQEVEADIEALKQLEASIDEELAWQARAEKELDDLDKEFNEIEEEINQIEAEDAALSQNQNQASS